jgi:phenylacetate-CoA ligase
LLPAFESGLKRRKTFSYWRELEQSQWLDRGELDKRQFDALGRLVLHASVHCPYYRDDWARRGIGPHALTNQRDFTRWPVITRDTVRAHRELMRSESAVNGLYSKATGGSTGTPLHFDYDGDSLDRRFAAWHRGYGWAGAAPGTKQFYFWGVPLGHRTWAQRAKDRLYNELYRRRVVSSFTFRESDASELVAAFNRYQPDVFVAYTNPLYFLARTILEKRLHPRPPKSIVVGAEKLHDFQRQLIEEVFQAPVFETYGTREFMLLGAECDRHNGLHLTAENTLLEIVDDKGDPTPSGQEGSVVVTDLTNYGMPFIRYATGDRAVAGFGKCPCGRGLPLLGQVNGRQLDVLRSPDGRVVPGEFFPHLLKDFPAVRRFQVTQTARDRVELRVVMREGSNGEEQIAFESEIRQVLGAGLICQTIQVKELPLTETGKFRVVVGLDASNVT